MIIISWNVRGLNSSPRQKVVRELVRNHSPDVLFLQETKVSVECLMSMAPKLWRNGQCQCIGAQGSSGVWHVSGTHERSNLCRGFPSNPPYPWCLYALSQENLCFSPMSMLLLNFKVSFLYGIIFIWFIAYFLLAMGYCWGL